MASYNYNIFNGLCDKAKELVIDAVSADKTFQFLYTCGLDEQLLGLTPIEQVFYLASQIYAERLVRTNNPRLFFEPQAQISVDGKNYRADFLLIEKNIGDDNEKFIDKLIVETDGKQWHTSTAQMNYDYERETALKLAGYDVLRFTGSQVFNTPFACGEKTYKYAENLKTIKEPSVEGSDCTDFFEFDVKEAIGK